MKSGLKMLLSDKHVEVEEVFLAQLHSDGKFSLDYYQDGLTQVE